MSKRRKKSKIPALLCRLLGTALLLFVILTFLPISVPRWIGYEVYNVVSGSMEPGIPVGSIVYVKPMAGRDIEAGQIVAFATGSAVVVHRVVENHAAESELITKGDANQSEDLTPTPYEAVIGVVVRHIPAIGPIMMVWSSPAGKILLLLLAVSGALFNMVASRF